MKVLDVLRGARALLAEPGAWTRGVYARNAFGASVPSNAPDACSWCAFGALNKIGGDFAETTRHATIALNEAVARVGIFKSGAATFNDRQETVEPVLALFDEAIATLEAT